MPICIVCNGNIMINDNICDECHGTGEISNKQEEDLLNPDNWEDIPF